MNCITQSQSREYYMQLYTERETYVKHRNKEKMTAQMCNNSANFSKKPLFCSLNLNFFTFTNFHFEYVRKVLVYTSESSFHKLKKTRKKEQKKPCLHVN